MLALFGDVFGEQAIYLDLHCENLVATGETLLSVVRSEPHA